MTAVQYQYSNFFATVDMLVQYMNIKASEMCEIKDNAFDKMYAFLWNTLQLSPLLCLL